MKLTYVRWSMTIIEPGGTYPQGLTLITDPVFRLLGKHQDPGSYTFQQMPRPDLVFISHTHLDHYAPSVLKQLAPDTPVWMPQDRVHKASRLGLKALRGLKEWESVEFGGIHFTAVPAKHGGGEIGLVIEADRNVYFAGDTALDRDLFQAIGERWHLDAVLLPIGDLRVLGLPIGHIGPKKAVEALRLLGEPQVVLPTHYSGMTLRPLVSFGGNPRKLSRAIHKAELGTVVGTTRPLETVEI